MQRSCPETNNQTSQAWMIKTGGSFTALCADLKLCLCLPVLAVSTSHSDSLLTRNLNNFGQCSFKVFMTAPRLQNQTKTTAFKSPTANHKPRLLQPESAANLSTRPTTSLPLHYSDKQDCFFLLRVCV